ncbi:MAG: calcium/sodium antiporter [Deltaproteobacteria bacterium]|nr:calcium/sodium antiporter [Deltaproteobacteria bacterium]
MLIPILLFIVGIIILYFGADWLVDGSSQLALRLGISPVIVGLTVVACGTSAPELVASLQAQLVQGAGDVVLGNVVGSNIYNVGFILGLSALIFPVTVHSDIIKREAPLALFASVVMLGMMWGGVLERWEGFLLLFGFVAYILLQVHLVRKARSQDKLKKEYQEEIKEDKKQKISWLLFLVFLGIGSLILGAKLLIDNAIILAEHFGISQRVIGLTLVAFGTSLPELATTLVAAFKKQNDIAVANVVGSNLFNILLILGSVAAIKPIHFEARLLHADAPFMVAVLVAMLLFILRKKQLNRLQGGLLLTSCLIYAYFLF